MKSCRESYWCFKQVGRTEGSPSIKAVDPLSLRRPHEQDVALMKQIVVVSRPPLVFPSLEKPPPTICQWTPTTQSSSGIKPVHTCDRLRGDWGFRPRFGWTFGSQRHLWLPSDDFELLLDGVGLFSRRNAPGDPRFYTRTNQCLEGNMQMSRGLVDFSFVGCFGGGFWFTGGEQTRRKNRSLSSCKYFYSNLLSLLSMEVYAGSSCYAELKY